MSRELLIMLNDYFDNKSEKSDKEKEISKLLKNETGFFTIASVHRENLTDQGFDAERITDENMEDLADSMCEDYRSQLFWNHLSDIAKIKGFPKKQ